MWCATKAVISRPADGHWHSSEPLRHRCCQCSGDLALQRSNLNARKSRLCFCENWVCANSTTNWTSSNATGNVFGGQLSGEEICSGKCLGVMYGGIVRAGKYPGKMSREKCWDPHAGLQVCTCSGYDLCHRGYVAYTLQIDTQTERQTDSFWPVILLVQPAGLIKTVNMLCWWLHLLYAWL